MHYGVQYYPEHWPEERWKVDAEMMQRAGINVVRMGEFAWSYFEPRDGVLNFEKYDDVIALLLEHGIKTILCTCSRTPPPWVFKKYPEILNVDADGNKNPSGGRYRVSHVHPDFIRESQRIDGAMIEHFAGNPGVEAWQIDNEIGSHSDCYSDVSVSCFQEYLKDKYKTIEALNEAWGAHFWSGSYSDWSEVPRPSANPQLGLEYRRFISKSNCDFNRWRTDLIRKKDPGKWITTNFQSIQTQHTDYRDMAQDLDVNGMNHYPKRSSELILDNYRQGNRQLIVLEQFTRLLDVDAGEGWMRLWAWMAIAHGCCGINFFRWRGCRWGAEQFADGLLPHSGKENRLYRELSKMGAELKEIGDRIDGTYPEAEVAVTFGYDSRWATSYIQKAGQVRCIKEAIRVHDSLMRKNITTDSLDPKEDLSKYQLLIAPQLMLVDDRAAENLLSHVEKGGVLCLTAHSGVVDEYGKSFDIPRPGPLAEAAGVEVMDMAILERDFEILSEGIPELNGQMGTILADELQVTTAEVLATFGSGWRKGLPVLTVNNYGKGKVFTLATILGEEAMDALTGHLCSVAGVLPIMETPPGVRAYERKGEKENMVFILNYSEEEKTITLPRMGKDAFSCEEKSSVTIPPVDLSILEM